MKSPDKCSVERHAVHVEEVGDVLAGAGAYKARFRTTAKSGAIEQRRRPGQVGTRQEEAKPCHNEAEPHQRQTRARAIPILTRTTYAQNDLVFANAVARRVGEWVISPSDQWSKCSLSLHEGAHANAD
jgi:hypothetical protein